MRHEQLPTSSPGGNALRRGAAILSLALLALVTVGGTASADEIGVGTYWKTTASSYAGPCTSASPWVHVSAGSLNPTQNVNTTRYVGRWNSNAYAFVDYWMLGATSHYDVFRQCSGGRFVNVWYRNGHVVGCKFQSYNFGLPTGSGYTGGWSSRGNTHGTCPI